MKFAIVTTTINKPIFLETLKEVEGFDAVNVIVVGDNKTPDLTEYCETIGPNVFYFSPSEQKIWLKAVFPDIDTDKVIPENDIRRRNIGFLWALKYYKPDVIISMDDDNFPLGKSWLNDLEIAMETKECFSECASANGIVNPCNIMDYDGYVYSRGYPTTQMYRDSFCAYVSPDKKKIMMHQMLWTNKPDVDSFTNIMNPDLNFKGFTQPANFNMGSESIKPMLVARENMYFPIDTQSIAFRKELAIFHAIYQEPLLGYPSHRYDDIWAGLFCQRLINEFGDGMSFGAPLVEHRRNTHNYAKDLQMEFIGSCLNPAMWAIIRNMPIVSRTYKEGFVEIAEKLPSYFKDYDIRVQNFIKNMCESMKIWVKMVEIVER